LEVASGTSAVARAFLRVKAGTSFLTIFMRWKAHATSSEKLNVLSWWHALSCA
jgi:hypothetical protein